MRDIYLGDSYDIVKRFWAHLFTPIAPLHANFRFVPVQIRAQYQRVTSIPVVESPPTDDFGLLLDPHTGIPFPSDGTRTPTVSNSPLEFIVDTFAEWNPKYLIVFDQSYHRRHELTPVEQRAAKMRVLASDQIQSFFYVSHAPFRFCSNSSETFDAMVDLVQNIGIPESRFQYHQTTNG